MSAGSPRAAVPQDLQGARAQQIQLLQYLLGFGGPPGSDTGGGATQRPRTSGLGPIGGNVPGATRGPTTGMGGPNNFINQQSNPLDRLQSFFGNLGMPPSALQRQGADALGTMLNQPTPEQRALDIAMPQLQGMLTGTGPQFERDLSIANQQGGRFGSANAILRGEALRNLYNLRTQTAGVLGLLSGNAGTANRGLVEQAFTTGQRQSQQSDVETQRRLQLLMQLLGVQQQNVFNVPLQQNDPLGGLGPLLGLGLGFIPGLGPAARRTQ